MTQCGLKVLNNAFADQQHAPLTFLGAALKGEKSGEALLKMKLSQYIKFQKNGLSSHS